MTPNLDEFDPEANNSAATPTTAWIDETTATLGGYLLGLCAFAALRCDSSAAFISRVTHRAPRPSAADPALGELEWKGAIVAVSLGVVAVGYGGLLLFSWRNPAAPVSSPATVLETAIGTAAAAVEIARPPVPAAPDVAHRGVSAAPRRARLVNASTLSAIWRRHDKRSLQHAFDNLRHETLALHRCGMEMTGTDRAVARCDGIDSSLNAVSDGGPAHRVRWTIDFQRTGNQWAIQRVSTR